MTMKSSTVLPRNARTQAALGPVDFDRKDWQAWVRTLRRYQLDSLVGWLIDAGRPFAFLSAQIMYMATPFVGGAAARVGQLLESDEDSRDFARLLASDSSVGASTAEDRGE